ncbi:MAG: hypothetical protein ACREFQ_19610 [Stellaceae bacterium]
MRLKPLAEWSEDDAVASLSAVPCRAGRRRQVRIELHNKKFALSVLETYFNVGVPPPNGDGAKERLIERLERASLIEDGGVGEEGAQEALDAYEEQKKRERLDVLRRGY